MIKYLLSFKKRFKVQMESSHNAYTKKKIQIKTKIYNFNFLKNILSYI